jgi:NAD(P)-dependent dehydrogenase (short-subunit alcohol dehydrogenase family)
MGTEAVAGASFGICSLSALIFRKRALRTPLQRAVGLLAFVWWQRYLASGCQTYTIVPTWYQPPRLPAGTTYETAAAGKTYLITGATNGGIGYWTAVQLYRMGGTVIVTSRAKGPDAAAALKKEIIAAAMMNKSEANPIDRLFVVDLDFDRNLHDTVAECTRQLDALPNGTGNRVDVLVNNAGAMFPMVTHGVPRRTAQGFEGHYGVNALGPRLLTQALLPRMPVGGRVVHVASAAHQRITSLDEAKGLATGEAVSPAFMMYYSASKFANICTAAAFARRDPAHQHVALHPGVVGTNVGRHIPAMALMEWAGMAPAVRAIGSLVMKTPLEGSYTTVHCCIDPEVPWRQGLVYYDNCVERPEAVTPLAQDVAVQDAMDALSQHSLDVAAERDRRKALAQNRS